MKHSPEYKIVSDFWIYDLDDGAIGEWKWQALVSEQTKFSGFKEYFVIETLLLNFFIAAKMLSYKGYLFHFADEKNLETFASIINFNQSVTSWKKIYYPNRKDIDSPVQNALHYHKNF